MFRNILLDEVDGQLVALVFYDGKYSVRVVDPKTNLPKIIKEGKKEADLRPVFYKQVKKMNEKLMKKNEPKKPRKIQNKKS